MMLIIGLTGSIGMGKSTAAAQFRARGVPVFDADAAVHALYDGPLADAIDAAFPGTAMAGKVDRAKLSAALVAAPHRFRDLEAIVHPHVRALKKTFLNGHAAQGEQTAVLEIPLLFEGGAAGQVDVTVVVSADRDTQHARVLARPGMTQRKLDALVARQLDDAEKRRRADFVVDTSGSVQSCNAQIDAILLKLAKRQGSAFARFWA
jgi:dephospho-CoA kinase